VKRLHEDYQDGLREFHRQASLDAQTRQELVDRERERTDEAAKLIARTQVTASSDVTAEFLRRRVEHLEQRLTEQADAEIAAQCRQLLTDMAQAPERFNEYLETYRRLADAEKRKAAGGMLREEIAVLREEIQSPLLEAPELAETRRQLLEQLDALQAVAVRQRTVARQGLTVLRRRVFREIEAQAQRRQAQAKVAAERRYLVGEIVAKMSAVLRVPDLPDITRQAQELSARLNQVLAGDDDNLIELQTLAQQAGELFAACENALSMQVVSAYIQDEVTDVMLSLGYQVTPIAGEGDRRRFLAPVDEEYGIEFQVDGGGRLGTEMVALHSGAAVTDPDAQEKICGIVDQMIEQLKAHHQNVREHFRTSLQPGEQLRVVETDAEESTTPGAVAAPKEMRIDE